MVDMMDVISSNIVAIGYDREAAELHVRFAKSGTYVYQDVACDIFDALMKAESKGKFLSQEVKPAYKVRKLDEAPPEEPDHLTLTMTRSVFEMLQHLFGANNRLQAHRGQHILSLSGDVTLELTEPKPGVAALHVTTYLDDHPWDDGLAGE